MAVGSRSGQANCKIGLIFEALQALGLVIDVQPDENRPDDVDLDAPLRSLGN
jgi:hypothetical protein